MDRDEDFTAFVAARWGALVRSAVFMGCSVDDARDLVQTAMLRCFKSWGAVERADDQDAYVYRVLLNCLRDSRRRRWWGEQPVGSVPDVQQAVDEIDRVDTADSVFRALGDLSAVNRQVVVLRYYAHLSEQQTSEVLRIAPGTVKSRLSRALNQLEHSPHLAGLRNGSTS